MLGRTYRTGPRLAAFVVASLTVLISAQSAAAAPTKYSIVGGCYALDGPGAGRSDPFRMQATDLATYLLYDGERRFLAAAGGGTERAAEPSAAAEWRAANAGDGDLRFTNVATGEGLALEGAELVQSGAERLSLRRAQGCPRYPEIAVNSTGTPSGGPTPYGETAGFVDMHTHTMFFEALGGRIHCGRPWHRYGVAEALPDCAEQEGPGGVAAPAQNFLNWGSPVYSYDTVGWPTFSDWPNWHSLTFEQQYYKWIERAWRGGLRLMSMLAVDNAALCKVYPFKVHPCNEMTTIRREIRDVYELQDYIDAQSGGPGKGWYRVVRNPFEARRVINQGKLAVVIGIETSVLFDCGVIKDVPQCGRADVDRGLAEVKKLGVRQMETINKFDNAFSGVAGDAGAFGVVTNTGNFGETGNFFGFETCTGEAHDRPALTGVQTDIGIGFLPLISPGDVPVYPRPPHCNVRGLTDLGEHLIKGMIEHEMLIDPDHMSAKGRAAVLNIVRAHDYEGIVSSHSWADKTTYPKVYAYGGMVTPYAGGSESFVEEWRHMRRLARKRQDPRYVFGIGYGSDTNGFGTQGPPRGGENPVRYPFDAFDGRVSLDRQRSGERTFDVNEDGVAHYGLYPDWVEDLRKLAGNKIVRDMTRGVEAYLITWEQAVGVPPKRCRPRNAELTSDGLGRLHLGDSAEQALRRAGQPERRVERVYSYCVFGKRNDAARVSAVFSGRGKLRLIASDANGHRAGGVAVGDRVDEIASARRISGRVVRRGAFLYELDGGRVETVAVASPALTAAEVRRGLAVAG